MKNKILPFLFIFTFGMEKVFSQDQNKKITPGPSLKLKKEQKMNHLKDELAKNREKIRELLGVDMLGDVSKRFEELMEKFHGNDMGSFFDDDNFNQFLDDWDPFVGLSQGSSHWMETPKERILILKYKAPKDSPVDIKIEKGKIQIRGSTEEVSESGGIKSKSVSSFNQLYTIPSDVDGARATFENKNGEILIKFPKKNPGKMAVEGESPKAQNRPTAKEEEKDNGPTPLVPKKGDINL